MLDRNTPTMPPAVEADRIASIGKALAHPARVKIITFLLSKPGCIGGDIVDEVGLAQSTISEHLRILKDAGFVQGAIGYARVCYALDPSALGPIRSSPSPIRTALMFWCLNSTDRSAEAGVCDDAQPCYKSARKHRRRASRTNPRQSDRSRYPSTSHSTCQQAKGEKFLCHQGFQASALDRHSRRY